MYDIDIIFLDGTVEKIRTESWSVGDAEGGCPYLKISIGRYQYRHFPLLHIKWWDSTRA